MLNFESFVFNPLILPNVLVGLLIFATGFFVFIQNRNNFTHISFFLLCIMINFWLFGRVIMYSTSDSVMALKVARWFAFFGVVNIAPMTYLFSIHWFGLYQKQKKLVYASLVLAAIFYGLTALTPYGIVSVHKYFWGFYPKYGIVCYAYLVFFLLYFFLAFYNFFSEIKHTTDKIRKKQVLLINIAFMVAFAGSIDYLPKIINFPIYPFGYLCVLFWILLIAYTIVKHRALDIQTVIHKTIMWFLASSVLGVPLVLFFYVQKEAVYRLPEPVYVLLLTVSFLTVVLFTRYVQPWIDHLFQRRQWDLTRAMERFNDALVGKQGLDDLSAHILETNRNLFYAMSVSLLVRNEKENRFEYADKGIKINPVSTQDPFIKWLEENDTIVFRDYLVIDPRLEGIAESGMRYFDAAKSLLCVPIVVNQQLLGVLNLGEKQNLQRYQPAEISFLNDFRRSAGIALANTLHIIQMQENLKRWNEELEKKVEERTAQLNETQAQLVQAEKLATIGTLAGGVAHEINNPLTAVLTNAQILKMDASEEDVESLELIEEGAKRCQTIIQNLLKYARKSETETTFNEVDVHKVIQNVCSLLTYQFKQDNVSFEMNLQQVSSIRGIANELEQVITNLLVNAKDAMKDNTDDRKKVIFVGVSEKQKAIEITVRDTGRGMPKKIQSKIFDPFFTTKDVGGGTGLGLSVSFGIVQKHKGSISVESTEGAGTTFTVRLPIQ